MSLASAVALAASHRKRKRAHGTAAPPKSQLAYLLQQQFAWGTMSATSLQAIALAAVEDGLDHPDVVELSRIGSSGMHKGNCRRDLLRSISSAGTVKVPEPTFFDIPVQPFKDRSGRVQSSIKHPILLPHELLHAMATTYPDHLASLEGVSTKEFWSKLDRSDPKYLNHPIRTEPHKELGGVPIVIHGDGAVYTTRQASIVSLQFKPLLAVGKSSWDSVFMMTAFAKEAARKETWPALWLPIVRSFKALYDLGVGEPPRTFHGVPWLFSADMEFLANEVGLPHWNANGGCCGFCDASWEGPSLVRNRSGFVCLACDDPGRDVSDHPIWDIPGICRHSAVYEWMHTADMGILTNLIGSTLAEFMLEGRGSHKVNLKEFWDESVSRMYAEMQVSNRISNVTKEMLGGKKSTFYNLSRCKAAELRHLVPVILEVLRRLDTGSDRDGHRILAFEHIAGCLDVVHKSRLFLSTQEHTTLTDRYSRFLKHYHVLRELAVVRGRKLYNLTFKFHALLHTVAYAKWCNPSAHWCYGFEDFMGKVVTAAQSCSHAAPPRLDGCKVLENYRLALHLQMQR